MTNLQTSNSILFPTPRTPDVRNCMQNPLDYHQNRRMMMVDDQQKKKYI